MEKYFYEIIFIKIIFMKNTTNNTMYNKNVKPNKDISY